jgi:hypothetical protein
VGQTVCVFLKCDPPNDLVSSWRNKLDVGVNVMCVTITMIVSTLDLGPHHVSHYYAMLFHLIGLGSFECNSPLLGIVSPCFEAV